MSITLRVRADARSLAGAAVLGSMVGLAIGGAYLAGGLARAAVVHAQISRLAANSEDFSESTLTAASAEYPGALAVARRLNPLAVAEVDTADRRIAAYALALEHRAHPGAPALVQRASLTPSRSSPVTPARPFLLRGVLEQSRDLECLTQAVYYEARGETRDGQEAVAQVVLNRTRHPAFPKTVCGVVFQRASSSCQFSFACDGSAARPVQLRAWRRAEDVAAAALSGDVMPDVGNATHFHVARINPGWTGNLQRVSQVGAHVFYRFSGRSGSSRAFEEKPQLSEPQVAPQPTPDAQPILASLTLAPLTTAVATTVVHSVAATAQAGADLVFAAKEAVKPEATAKPILTPTPPLDPGKPADPVRATSTVQATAAPTRQGS